MPSGAGDAQAAAATWQAAVETASELAIAPNPVLDPILWEHAGYLRPVDTAWPAPVRRRLAEVQVGFGIVSPASNQVGPGATMPSATDEYASCGPALATGDFHVTSPRRP